MEALIFNARSAWRMIFVDIARWQCTATGPDGRSHFVNGADEKAIEEIAAWAEENGVRFATLSDAEEGMVHMDVIRATELDR